jgi:hypothetical protein
MKYLLHKFLELVEWSLRRSSKRLRQARDYQTYNYARGESYVRGDLPFFSSVLTGYRDGGLLSDHVERHIVDHVLLIRRWL